jgi:hypothetical protein
MFYFTFVETYYFITYSIFVSYNLQLCSYNLQVKFHCQIQYSADSTVTVGKYAMLFNIKKKTIVSDAEIKLHCNFNMIKI